MKRRSRVLSLILAGCVLPLLAQAQLSFLDSTPAASSSAEGDEKPSKESASKEKPPMEITSTKETNFDEKTRTAVFLGSVTVKDTEFLLTCDKLTVVLRRPQPKGEATKAKEPEGSGLESAVAEGSVVIVQEKPDEKGKITRYVGKAKKMEYNAITGDVTLRGWPQIQQGINKQVATEEGTVMILNKNGRLRTIGASRTEISESTDALKQDRKRTSAQSGTSSTQIRLP